MHNKYRKTILACFVSFIVQAVVNNFAPLLFITFQHTYGISLSLITTLITINFLIQLSVDFASAFFVDKIGYRTALVMAHTFSALGLILLTILPEIPGIPPFVGILISVIFYAVGGGLIEVVGSPVVEACPSDNKEKTMSLLHSFYCWGSVAVAAVSTAFFSLFGIENWKILSIFWAIIPILNGIAFMKVPLCELVPEGEKKLSLGELFKNRVFILLMLVITCAGACELSVSQWASAFVESALGISKSFGDLVGPALFAVFMGISRVIYGKYGDKLDLEKTMLGSSILCVVGYLALSLTQSAVLSLVGVAICGFSVGILWPGTYSTAAASIKGGGNSMFSFLALAGDLGCSSGPTLVGIAAAAAGDDLKKGILAAAVFPLLLTVLMALKLGLRRAKTE